MTSRLGAMSSGHSQLQDASAARSGLRADARRNHERIIAAAIEVFSERGLEATVRDVAARAGVGNATVYRSYPTKADLVEVVARHQLGWFAEQIQAATRRPDAFEALQDLFGDIAERRAGDRFLAEVLPHARQWREENNLTEQFAQIIANAQAQGKLRTDATTLDIQVLVGGCSRVLLDLDVQDPGRWRRYAMLALDALRPWDEPA